MIVLMGASKNPDLVQVDSYDLRVLLTKFVLHSLREGAEPTPEPARKLLERYGAAAGMKPKDYEKLARIIAQEVRLGIIGESMMRDSLGWKGWAEFAEQLAEKAGI